VTAPTTPYADDLGDRDPLAAIRDTVGRIRAIAGRWAPDRLERSYAPGKWSARQILTHLAQTELALGNRARMALATSGYVAQAFDQDAWIARETRISGPEALDTFLALARMNVLFFDGLSIADRATRLSHPEYGALTIDWIIHQIAGHQVHHLRQLERIV
jgi:DinB family protein